MSSSVQHRWCRGVADRCFRRAAQPIAPADCPWQPLNSNVRQHTHFLVTEPPMLIEHTTLPERELAPGIFARLMHGTALTVMRVRLDAGARLPRHAHPHEQVTTVLSGHLQLTVGDTVCELGPGTTVFIPSGTSHHALAVEPTDAIDVFTPVREDYR